MSASLVETVARAIEGAVMPDGDRFADWLEAFFTAPEAEHPDVIATISRAAIAAVLADMEQVSTGVTMAGAKMASRHRIIGGPKAGTPDIWRAMLAEYRKEKLP